MQRFKYEKFGACIRYNLISGEGAKLKELTVASCVARETLKRFRDQQEFDVFSSIFLGSA